MPATETTGAIERAGSLTRRSKRRAGKGADQAADGSVAKARL